MKFKLYRPYTDNYGSQNMSWYFVNMGEGRLIDVSGKKISQEH